MRHQIVIDILYEITFSMDFLIEWDRVCFAERMQLKTPHQYLILFDLVKLPP